MSYFKFPLVIMSTFLISACVGLPQGHLAYGSKNDWKTYETKIDDVILQYSFPHGQSKDFPKPSKVLQKINTSSLESQKDFDYIKIIDGSWSFGGSLTKYVNGTFDSWIMIEHSLNDFSYNISDLSDLKKSILHTSYEDWKIRNDEHLKAASYYTDLKYIKPSGFEKVNINGSIWLKYDNAYYSYPINSKFHITVFVDRSFAITEEKHILQAKQMADRIINSLKITKVKKDLINK